MENYLRKIRNEEQSKNINKIKVSSWYPSNLLSPVRVNGRIFNPKEKNKKETDEEIEDFINTKNEKIQLLKFENKAIETNPLSSLSSKHDDFSYTNRLVPLYRTHIIYK